ncbi:BTAD domain-containing putative transcriptional regulator [Streptomyces sp. NPDC020298]|uniref:BTAD domain-containing putative transcriptional regulator n=1 Tax=unclassified Streptomyces TaxID=2593676 RepID=UPI00340099BF
MRFSILGRTRAHHDDGTEVPLGGPARRALLAALLIEPGRVVPAERLAEETGTGKTASAHAVQSQVSRLRSALGPAAPVERAGTGYRIIVPYDAVDAGRFERLTREGRTALAAGDPGRAAELLREALGLWRGPALADLADSDSARAAVVRLEELRLAALEDRLDAELLLGEHRAAIPELRQLTEDHPLRERAAGLLMRALSAEGGQAAALAVYEATRRHLAEELGADPSPHLTALHQELLSADPAPRPARPPAQLTALVGRDTEVAALATLLDRARLVTLTGPGGVGKTRLAVAAAAACGEVCFVPLAALRDDTAVPGALLGALGLSGTGLRLGPDGPAPLDRVVTALSDRTVLLVLDNCEHLLDATATLTARLLAACPELRVLATSREPLGIIGEHLHPVRPLDPASAVRLFTDRATAVRPALTADQDTVRRVCAALDNLPLAVELAAARLRTLDLDDLARRLDDRLGMAARGGRTGDGRHRTLRSVVAWSWELLPETERRAARRFAVFASGATAATALRVCGTDPDTLEALADKSLLDPADGRYRMLETVRAYAAEQLDAAGETDTVRRAHAAHLLDLARTADPHLRGAGQLAWLAQLTAEHDDLLGAVRWAVEAPAPETALALLAAAAHALWIRSAPADAAHDAARLLEILDGEPPAGHEEEFAICVLLAASGPDGGILWHRYRARAEAALGTVWPDTPGTTHTRGRHPAALLLWTLRNAVDGDPHRAHALLAARRDDADPWLRAVAHYVTAYGALGADDPGRAEEALRTAADIFRTLGDHWGTALVLDTLAALAGARGDRTHAVALTDEALTLTERLGAHADTADLLAARGDHLAGTDPALAHADYTRAADLARRTGSPASLAATLRGLGDLALSDGDPDGAERLYREALERLDARWVRSLGTRVRTLTGLARVAEARGEGDTARLYYRQAAEAVSLPGATAPAVLRLLGLPEPVAQAVRRG